jgi:hypothetical protein
VVVAVLAAVVLVVAASEAAAAALAAAARAALGRGDFYKSKQGKLGSDIRKLPAMAYLRI